jgi:hypothetical protein
MKGGNIERRIDVIRNAAVAEKRGLQAGSKAGMVDRNDVKALPGQARPGLEHLDGTSSTGIEALVQ